MFRGCNRVSRQKLYKVAGASSSKAENKREQDAPASVIMTTYNPVSVNLNATEPRNGGEAEGNCVAARRGGKQPDAKEQSQIPVNSIRYLSVASLLANGEALVLKPANKKRLQLAELLYDRHFE